MAVNEQQVRELIVRLRERLHAYRSSEQAVSIHLSAIDMVIVLVEYGMCDPTKRAIRPGEEDWFNAGRMLDELYRNSEWHDLVDGYYELAGFAKQQGYFRG